MTPGFDPHARALLLGGLALGLGARVTFALVDDGLWWPDEYYQSLEPAHRLVFGYGWQAWEFVRGARHWTLPGLVAGVMQLAAWLGLPYLRAVELACVAVGAGTSLAVAALSRALGASARSAAVVATVFSLMGLAVFMAPRAMGEGLSALPVTAAFALLVGRASTPRVLLAGALLSLAVGLRLQNGLFCLGALGLLWRHGRRRDVGVLFGALAGGAAIYGLVDALTWGAPFHSALEYVRFNVVEGGSGHFGKAHVFHYVVALVTAEGLTVVPLVALAVVGARPRPELLLVVLGFFVVHSFIPHKELRFVFPLLPLVAAQAGVGLDRVSTRWQAGVLALALLSLVTLPTLTFGRLGVRNPPPQTPALDYGGPENRLLVLAGRRDDVCGLRIESLPHWRTGGFAYFHRPVPLYRAERPGEGAGHFNAVIARRGTVPGDELAVDHDVALVRLPEARCAPDPGYDWHLE